jgi:hypothetical protein
MQEMLEAEMIDALYAERACLIVGHAGTFVVSGSPLTE